MITLKNHTQYNGLQTFTLTFVLLVVLAGCAQNEAFPTLNTISNTDSASSAPPDTTATPIPTVTPAPTPTPIAKAEPLAWESSSHPERAAWSAAAIKYVTQYFPQLDAATDVTAFCAPYRSLNKDQKINLLADIFAATASYECAWDPKSASVDVGTSNNKDTWSVGLLQLSVVDQANYGFKFVFNFADLQEPDPNLQLGIAIMAKQITKHGAEA